MDRIKQHINGLAFVCQRVDAKVPKGFLFDSGFGYRLVSCIGQVGSRDILDAFDYGAERVLLFGCPDSGCRHQIGSKTAREQVAISQRLLELLGLSGGQVRFVAVESEADVRQVMEKAATRLRRLPVYDKKDEDGTEVNFPLAGMVCEDCGRCSGVCPVSRTGFGFSPRRLIQQAIVNRTSVPEEVIYSCLGCELCSSVCPAGVKIADDVLGLRAISFQEGKKPALAHGGVFQILGRMMAKSLFTQNRLGWVESGLRVAEKGDIVLFTGCLLYFEPLFKSLGIDFISTLRNTVRSLNAVGIEPVVMADERCCGYDLLALGDVGKVRRLARHNLEQLQRAGAKKVVFICPECLATFKLTYPRLLGVSGLELVHISQVLVENGFPAGKTEVNGHRVTYQDSCHLGRRLGVYDEPRRLICSVPGAQLVEMEHRREMALCCGGTHWLECGAAVRRLQERRLAEVQATGADVLITSCPRCQIHLACAQKTLGRDDFKIVHLVDFICKEG